MERKIEKKNRKKKKIFTHKYHAINYYIHLLNQLIITTQYNWDV